MSGGWLSIGADLARTARSAFLVPPTLQFALALAFIGLLLIGRAIKSEKTAEAGARVARRWAQVFFAGSLACGGAWAGTAVLSESHEIPPLEDPAERPCVQGPNNLTTHPGTNQRVAKGGTMTRPV